MLPADRATCSLQPGQACPEMGAVWVPKIYRVASIIVTLYRKYLKNDLLSQVSLVWQLLMRFPVLRHTLPRLI